MIGKQEKGRSFRKCLRYVLEKKGAQCLGGNMLGTSIDELSAEFEAICRLNPRLDVVVYHAMLSVSAEERRTDEQWRAIVASYLRGMGFEHSQYLIVRHTDEDHDHVHIIASRIQIPDGKSVSDSNDYRRSENLIRDLERIYGLEPVVSSYEQLDRAPTTGEVRKFEKQHQQFEQGLRANPPDPPIRVVLQILVSQLSESKPAMPELIQQLQRRGVEVRVRFTEKEQWGISYKLCGQSHSGTQLGRAYTFQGLQKHKGISYESERDDPAISAATSQQSRIPARSAPNTGAAERVNSGTDSLEATIHQVDFTTSALTGTAYNLGAESARLEAGFGELLAGIEADIDQEALEAVAGTIADAGKCLECDRRESRQTDGVRQGIEEFTQQLAVYLEQHSSKPVSPTPTIDVGNLFDDDLFDDSLSVEVEQWYEQLQHWRHLEDQYAFYGVGVSSPEQRDLAIAQAAFDDGLAEGEVFKVVACGDQADSLVQAQGVAEASQYIQRLIENARFQLQLLLIQQQGYDLPQISKERQQSYYNPLPDQNDETQSDLAIAQDVYQESKNWDEAMAIVGSGHSARRIAYQQGVQAWVDYVNETITQAHNHLTHQAEDVSASVVEDDEIELSCDWKQRQWVARPEEVQELQKSIQRSQRELSIAQKARAVLDEELASASQANLIERLLQDKEDLKLKRAKSEKIGTRIYGLESELKKSRSTLNYYQSSISSEESRLETVYTTLVQEVQDKLSLQDPRAIDQRIALEILRASPQPEEDLNALNFSSQIQSVRGLQGGEDQVQVYLNEIIEGARGIYRRSQALEALRSWEIATMALQRPYAGRIAGIIQDFKQGELLSHEIKEVARGDLAIYQSELRDLENWHSNAQKLNRSADYLQSIQRITEQFQSGIPLSEQQSSRLEFDRKAASQLSKQQNQLQL